MHSDALFEREGARRSRGQQSLAMLNRERRPDGAPDVLVAGGPGTGEKRKGSTRHARTGQSAQACLRRDVPTTMRLALSRVETTPKDSAGCTPGSRANARSHPHSGPRREGTEDGWRRKRDEPEQPSSGANLIHPQRSEGEKSGAGDHQTTRST